MTSGLFGCKHASPLDSVPKPIVFAHDFVLLSQASFPHTGQPVSSSLEGAKASLALFLGSLLCTGFKSDRSGVEAWLHHLIELHGIRAGR